MRELVGWGLDAYRHRPVLEEAAAQKYVACQARFEPACALVADVGWGVAEELAAQACRPDLLEEMEGLRWSCGVVDLGALQAFQRRLAFDDRVPGARVPEAGDGRGLMEFAFAPIREVEGEMDWHVAGGGLCLRTSDPNVQLRRTGDEFRPLQVYGGSPFFEVARYRGRWFLRDGYHRAYAALCAGVRRLPALIVEARTLEELGAGRAWFFAEEVLMAERPPLVTDFLRDEVTVEYERAALLKTICVTWDESFGEAEEG